MLTGNILTVIWQTVFYWSFADKNMAKQKSLIVSHGTSVVCTTT
jgi:Ca2+:H+ antiporter